MGGFISFIWMGTRGRHLLCQGAASPLDGDPGAAGPGAAGGRGAPSEGAGEVPGTPEPGLVACPMSGLACRRCPQPSFSPGGCRGPSVRGERLVGVGREDPFARCSPGRGMDLMGGSPGGFQGRRRPQPTPRGSSCPFTPRPSIHLDGASRPSAPHTPRPLRSSPRPLLLCLQPPAPPEPRAPPQAEPSGGCGQSSWQAAGCRASSEPLPQPRL